MARRVKATLGAAALVCLAGSLGRGEVGANAAQATAPAAAGKAAKDTDMLTREAIERRIEQHRTAEAEVTVLGPDGQPLAGARVTVRQTRHKFLFGCNAFGINTGDESARQKAYQERFAALLNFGTLPFYWGVFEREEGKPDHARVAMMAAWCRERGIRTKGHPLMWHTVFPGWMMERPLEEVRLRQMGRIRRDVAPYVGTIDLFDVVNEGVVLPGYTATPSRLPELAREAGRVALIKEAFDAARSANPEAVLVLNDYDTSEKYVELIRECLDAGVGIDAIGIQSHMHGGYWGDERTWEVCEQFAQFGKPLHFTEVTLISGPKKENQKWHGRYDDWHTTPEHEQTQAANVASFYTVLFSHPSVEAITWWDFQDGQWLGAPAGLVREDMAPKPAYERLMGLVKGAWWTGEATLRTDAAGRATFRGFLGDYTAEGDAGTGAFALEEAGKVGVVVRLGERAREAGGAG